MYFFEVKGRGGFSDICRTYIVIIIYLHHWSINTGSKALHRTQCKETIFGCFTHLDSYNNVYKHNIEDFLVFY